MMAWQEFKLADAPLEILDGDRGKNYPSQDEFKSEGYCLFLSTKNVRFDGFEFSECQFISRERDELLRKGKLEKYDLVLTTRGTVGNIGFYDDSVDFPNVRINSGMVIIRPKQEELLPAFNYYLFRKLQDDFHTFISGSAQPQLPIKDLKEVEVAIPPPDEQKAIAAVLSSLDDKIELLHRQNKTLEAMSETLFRQWFVEEAQEDWEEGKVEDLFVLQRGFDLPAQNRTDGPYPIYAASGNSGGHTEYKVKGPGVTTGRSGLLGKVFYVPEDFWPLNTSLYVREFKRGTPLFSYFFLKTLDLEAYNAGSAVPTLNRNHVHEASVLLPPCELVVSFEETASPLYKKIKKNELQIITLEKLRDTLLPKLMSGEVRVAVDA